MTAADPAAAATRVRELTALTRQLSERLEKEMTAFEARRPQDVAGDVAQTQALANLYRRESAQVRAAPDLIAGAPQPDRLALRKATEMFEALLARHALAVDAARRISEGLVRAIAGEVAHVRAQNGAYGPGGQAAAGDGRAVALNRKA